MPIEIQTPDADDLQSWTLDHWNDALYRHFFTAPQHRVAIPVVRLYVTAESLRAAASARSRNPEEVRSAFIDSVKRAVGRRSLALDASRRRKRWSPEAPIAPPFLAHLLLTCMVANDLAEKLKSMGNFRERLSLTLGTQSQPALQRLRPLWEEFAEWSVRRNLADAECRPLHLPRVPDSGYHSIIGYSIRLAVPSRRDQAVLASLMHRHALAGSEPEINSVIRVVSENLARFSVQFDEVFREFMSGLKSQRTSLLFHTTFWTAVREVALSGLRGAERESESLKTRLELEDDEGRFWLALTSDAEIQRGEMSAVLLPGARRSRFRFVLTDREGSSLVGRAFSSNKSNAKEEQVLGGVRSALAIGLVLFEETDDDVYAHSTTFPSNGRIKVLVSDRLSSAFRAAVEASGLGPEVTRSAYEGWSEWRGLSAAGLRLLDLSNFPSLLAIRSLRATLSPPEIRLRGGIRFGNSFVALSDAMPFIEVPEAERVSLELDRGNWMDLEKVASRADTWGFGSEVLIEQFLGTHRIVAFATSVPIAEKEISFVEAAFSRDYKRPSDPSRWLVESAQSDTVVFSEDAVSVMDLQEPHAARRIVVSGTAKTPGRFSATGKSLLKLTTVLSSQFAAQRGVSEGSLVTTMNSTLGLKTYELWPILRGWVEAGMLDVLSDARWRARMYFARMPQLVVYRHRTGYEAVMTGLIPPFLLERFHQLSATFSLVPAAQQSDAARVPPLPRCRSRQVEQLAAFARELNLPPLTWLRAPGTLGASIRSVIERQSTEPQNWPVYREWDWTRRTFTENPAQRKCSDLSLQWCRRDDGPDCYKLHRFGSLVWWTRSRTWAVLAAFTLAALPVFERGAGGVIESRGDSLYLPLPLARIAAVLGPKAPGPVQSSDGKMSYQYTFPDDSVCDSILDILWPSGRKQRMSAATKMRLIAISRAGSGPLVPLPLALRRTLQEVCEDNEIAALGFVPASVLPRLYGLVGTLVKGDVS